MSSELVQPYWFKQTEVLNGRQQSMQHVVHVVFHNPPPPKKLAIKQEHPHHSSKNVKIVFPQLLIMLFSWYAVG